MHFATFNCIWVYGLCSPSPWFDDQAILTVLNSTSTMYWGSSEFELFITWIVRLLLMCAMCNLPYSQVPCHVQCTNSFLACGHANHHMQRQHPGTCGMNHAEPVKVCKAMSACRSFGSALHLQLNKLNEACAVSIVMQRCVRANSIHGAFANLMLAALEHG